MKLTKLLNSNKVWSENVQKYSPDFFDTLSKQQKPEYLWIGCSDSRVPANQVVGLVPGEIFVHRNIANVVVHTDLNCLSVIQYAVEYLGVKHIIVCGHYGCGGVEASMGDKDLGLIDNWLRHIKDVYRFNKEQLEEIKDQKKRFDKLCELNVIEQVANVSNTTTVKRAWKKGADLTVHGWIYGLKDGIVNDLEVSVNKSHTKK
ncbi:carbonate dehydratase [Francisellaceae bacterium]|nr:carbonate dehydratase [Francisellaceae bacterium]